MANGPDFRFRSQFPISGIAQLLAQKTVQEEQIRLAQAQEKRAKFNQFLNTVSTAASLARVGQQFQAQRFAQQQAQQQAGDVDVLAGALSRQVPGTPLTGSTGPVPLSPQVRQQQDLIRSSVRLSPEIGVAKVFPEPVKDKQSTRLNSLITLRSQFADQLDFAVDEPLIKRLRSQIGALDKQIAKMTQIPDLNIKEDEVVKPKETDKKKASNLQKIKEMVQEAIRGLRGKKVGTIVTMDTGERFQLTPNGIRQVK